MTAAPGRRGEALAALCGGLLACDDGDARVLADDLAELLDRLPVAGRLGFGAGIASMNLVARASTGRSLAQLDAEGRERLVAQLAGGLMTGDLVEAVKVPVLLARSRRLGHGDPAPPPPARPDPELDVVPATHWPSCSTADVVVVGSGAGGAMVARTLARRGLTTLVLEEGRRFGVEEFRTRQPLDRFTDLYRDAGATAALGWPPVILPIGRGVGGTTLVNSGTCYRTPASVLASWRDTHGVALADPAAFGVHLDEVEQLLGVAPVPLDVMGGNGRVALRGATALGWASHPLRRNAPGCAGRCECAVGCPQNAKAGVHLNALPDACAAGARIVSEARVGRILHWRGRATGVHARRADGTSFEILAPIVVVAAGATETPPLLRRSGLGRHRHLGRNLAIHPAVSAGGWFDERVDATRGVLQSAGIDELHERDGILIEATSAPAGLGTMVLPGAGRALRAQLDRFDHLATLGAMIGDAPSGSVHGRTRSVIRYDLAPADARRLGQAIGAMGRVLFAAGATSVVTGIRGHENVTSVAGLDEAVGALRPGHLHVAAFHPTGTARMGRDPATHPVDELGRLRGVGGVWIADASVLPSCPEVNPQLTIMAMALSIAAAIPDAR